MCIRDSNEIINSNIAATLLKIQERKTAKGNPYAVLKLTDLTSVFELFIFSEVLEKNRETLKEGSSLILTVIKSNSEIENRFRRINVQKIASLSELLNKPIEEVMFQIKSLEELKEISKITKLQIEKLTNKPITVIPFWINQNIWKDEERNIYRKKYKFHFCATTLNSTEMGVGKEPTSMVVLVTSNPSRYSP